jgi:hypothetical protein
LIISVNWPTAIRILTHKLTWVIGGFCDSDNQGLKKHARRMSWEKKTWPPESPFDLIR